MRGVRNIVSALAAVAAILIASASGMMGSSAASACLYDGATNVVAGPSSHHFSHKAHRHASGHEVPAPTPAAGGPADPRLDCAACMAVLPNFPSMARQELMPFMPEAQTFEPLFGVDPALDPPPPRTRKS